MSKFARYLRPPAEARRTVPFSVHDSPTARPASRWLPDDRSQPSRMPGLQRSLLGGGPAKDHPFRPAPTNGSRSADTLRCLRRSPRGR
jgi:hypothetical protein